MNARLEQNSVTLKEFLSLKTFTTYFYADNSSFFSTNCHHLASPNRRHTREKLRTNFSKKEVFPHEISHNLPCPNYPHTSAVPLTSLNGFFRFAWYSSLSRAPQNTRLFALQLCTITFVFCERPPFRLYTLIAIY